MYQSSSQHSCQWYFQIGNQPTKPIVSSQSKQNNSLSKNDCKTSLLSAITSSKPRVWFSSLLYRALWSWSTRKIVEALSCNQTNFTNFNSINNLVNTRYNQEKHNNSKNCRGTRIHRLLDRKRKKTRRDQLPAATSSCRPQRSRSSFHRPQPYPRSVSPSWDPSHSTWNAQADTKWATTLASSSAAAALRVEVVLPELTCPVRTWWRIASTCTAPSSPCRSPGKSITVKTSFSRSTLFSRPSLGESRKA